MESKFIARLVDFNISITFYPSDAYNFLSELAPKGKVTSTNIWFFISFPKVHNEDWLWGNFVGLQERKYTDLEEAARK